MTRLRCSGRVFAALCLIAMLLSACGGGGGGGAPASGGGVVPAAPNVQAVRVEQGPPTSNIVNGLFVTVTICVPGTQTCQDINHVLVDTGSNGLRIMASVLNPDMALLPFEYVNTNQPIAECAQFADGYTWGPVKVADVRIAGERAQLVPIQVIDPAFNAIPGACANSGRAENTVADFGANGLIGVGVFKADCGSLCAANLNDAGFYYLCPCTQTTHPAGVPEESQVQNPVAMFANDNNGVIIQLPPIPLSEGIDIGAASLSGTMTFGIATESNNALGSAQVLTVDPATGMLSTLYNGQQYTQSLLDSGSSVTFFNDSTIKVCTTPGDPAFGFYCPDGTLRLAAQLRGLNDVRAALPVNIANAHDLFVAHPGYWAFDNLAAPLGSSSGLTNSFIWGLPAFMGRKIYVVIEGQSVPGTSGDAGVGPYFGIL